MTTENQAPEGALTDEQIDALMPEPDGSAEANVERVEVAPGVWGTEHDGVDAWSRPLVRQVVRAALAAQPQSTHPADASKSASSIDTPPAEGDANLLEAVEAYLEAQGALDNRELMGPSAAPYEELRRACNKAHADLEDALHAAKTAPVPPAYATEINRLRNVIQAACLGGTDLMLERWKQLFPDAPVPTVHASNVQPKGTPAGYKLLEDGKTMIPESWTPLRLEWEPGYPEDVACGPVRAMERLKKWLDAYFVMIQQRMTPAKPRDWMSELGFVVRRDDGDVWLMVDDCGNEREATLNERVLWDALTATPAQAPAPAPEPVNERKQAEYQYSITAFDYAQQPVGSRDWCLYWDGWRARAAVQAPAVQHGKEQPKPAQAFLCRAWGESDFPAAELVPDWAGVRAFMVREWTGSEDATADDGTNYLDELKEEFDAHEEDRRGGPYEIEFEIGGVSVERVTGFAFYPPVQGGQP